jgi:formate hydrogenlyase transcriptional activator
MCSAGSESTAARWLAENGPRELELLFRAIVYHPSAPILITDDEGNSRDASVGLGKLLGLSREKIIGRPIDDFAQPGFKPQISQLWRALEEQEEQEGTLGLVRPDASLRDVEYTAKGNVLPVRHVLVLRDKTAPAETEHAFGDCVPSWVQDYALYLLDIEGRVAAWYAGAARIYSYQADEAIGQHVSFLYREEDTLRVKLQEEFKRAAAEGHLGTEGWQVRKGGSRFWANAITMALKDENGELQGFARVVRDFSERHERDEKLRRSRAHIRPIPSQSTIAGVVSGEFDHVPEANDAFLELIGYSREDLLAGRLHWPDLTPPEYTPLDELAHEEGLRFGACTPFQKELIRKDGTRVPVLVVTAVLKLSPFRWITFVQDLRERDRLESIEDEDVELKQNFEELVGGSGSAPGSAAG